MYELYVLTSMSGSRLAITDIVWAGMPCVRSLDRHVKHRACRFS